MLAAKASRGKLGPELTFTGKLSLTWLRWNELYNQYIIISFKQKNLVFVYSVPFPFRVILRPRLFPNHINGITSPTQVKIILISHKQLNTGNALPSLINRTAMSTFHFVIDLFN